MKKILTLAATFLVVFSGSVVSASCGNWETFGVTQNRCIQTHCGIWSSTALSQRYDQRRYCDGRWIYQSFERHNACDC